MTGSEDKKEEWKKRDRGEEKIMRKRKTYFCQECRGRFSRLHTCSEKIRVIGKKTKEREIKKGEGRFSKHNMHAVKNERKGRKAK